jgi:hypothetical protein
MASTSGKRCTLSIQQKLEILEALKSKKAEDVAKDFNIGYSTVKKIRQNEEEIRKIVMNNGNLSRKRKRESPNEEIGEALIVWFNQMRAQNAMIHGPLMMEKARQLAITLEHQDFEPSHGWLERLKARHNIKFIKVSGEQVSADKAGAENWINNVLPGMIEGYDLNDVFNADETGLYYKAAPSGTLAVSGTQPSGAKTPKDRMTVLLLCNSMGTEKKAYAIGKFKNPRCFKKSRPPLPYYSSANAWMTGWIWSNILQKFDQELGNRKILLFADNASCHKINETLKNIKIIFMPPNTTSLIQPLDQGIIRTVKVHYRTQVMRRMLQAVDNGTSIIDYAKSIDILKALHMLKRAWFLVSPTTIQNCFRKAGFLVNGNTNNVDEIQEALEVLEFNEAIQEEDFKAFVDCDKEAECFGNLTDVEICDAVKLNRQGMADLEEEDEEEEAGIVDKPMPGVSHKDALMGLSLVRSYLEEHFTDYNSFYDIEDMIEKNVSINRTQRKITDFFK